MQKQQQQQQKQQKPVHTGDYVVVGGVVGHATPEQMQRALTPAQQAQIAADQAKYFQRCEILREMGRCARATKAGQQATKPAQTPEEAAEAKKARAERDRKRAERCARDAAKCADRRAGKR